MIHLHVHSQYSLLDGYASAKQLFDRAGELGMDAVAVTDSANLSAVPEFLKEAVRHPGIKPIIGCELPVTLPGGGRTGEVVLLAKDLSGYQNLLRLISAAYADDGNAPRVSRDELERFHEGLICLSGSVKGEIPQAILAGDLAAAREAALWYKATFGEDFYLEVTLQQAGPDGPAGEVSETQSRCYPEIIRLGRESDIQVVATNDVRFARKEDAAGYGLLSSLGSFEDRPSMPPHIRQAYMKGGEEMRRLFPGQPEVIDRTREIADKIGTFDIRRPLDLPEFPIPERETGKASGFMRHHLDIVTKGAYGEDGLLRESRFFRSMPYLGYLAFHGARQIYGKVLPQEVEERLTAELNAISAANLPDLFLIVWDLVRWARKHGVCLSPGRGSAPGSLVLYCLGITEVDPLRHGLLFERFMNAETSPIIYLDIDKEGRSRAIDYLTEKYGADSLALVSVFGTLTPRHPRYDERLEGVVCRRGVHACAIVLGGEDLDEILPMGMYEEKDGKHFRLSQYPSAFLHQAGAWELNLIELDTLIHVKECLALVKKRHGVKLRLEDIPQDDLGTFSLFKQGDTDGVFHFEAPAMRAVLRRVKPDRMEDLIMLDALFRPDSMMLLPRFAALKNGGETLPQTLPEVTEILAETFGMTIYQEQVMEIARRVAGFSPGRTDQLRKSLCRNDEAALDVFRSEFINGGVRKGHREDSLVPIWESWRTLGRVIFNKSHAACYALLGYRTAWLKAHYPEEFEETINKPSFFWKDW